MSHPGWFRRSGAGGELRWTPDTADNHRQSTTRDGPAASRSEPGPSERFPVEDVNGGPPTDLDAFVGVAIFTVVKDGMSYRVFGSGRRSPGSVAFVQQDLGSDGRGVRSWTITATPDGVVAELDGDAVEH